MHVSDLTVCPKNECKILMNLIIFDLPKLETEPMSNLMTMVIDTTEYVCLLKNVIHCLNKGPNLS